jgi:hydrogenase maturation protease
VGVFNKVLLDAVAMKNIVLVGVGNLFRRDDGIGITIARRLRERLKTPPGTKINITESSGEGADLMRRWEGADQVFIFDAVMSRQSGVAIGTVHRLEAAAQKFPSEFFKYSSHAFSLAEAVELARVLDKLPKKLVVYGVEAKEFGYGENLMPQVDAAGDEVVKCVCRELDEI